MHRYACAACDCKGRHILLFKHNKHEASHICGCDVGGLELSQPCRLSCSHAQADKAVCLFFCRHCSRTVLTISSKAS